MKKRILSLFLVLAMCMSFAPVMTAVEAAQAKKAVNKQNVMPGVGSPLGYDLATGKYDTLYYGTYYAEEDAEGEPYAWRILDGETCNGEDGLFLLSMRVYDGIRFTLPYTEQENWYASPHNVWTSAGCSAREWCRSLAASVKLFSDAERSALFATDKADSSYNSKQDFFNSYYGRVRNGALDKDKVFYLSAEEFEDERYGLSTDVDYDAPRYALRSAVDESYTVDDITIHDGTIAVSRQGSGGSDISTVRIYHQEFSGYQFPKELTAAEKFFIGSSGDMGFFGNFFPTGAEEYYTYQYNAVIARPAMNLDGNKIFCITAADNSGHINYGVPDDYSDNTEWKAVLINDDGNFKNEVSVTDMPKNNLFDGEGGTVTISHPSLDTLEEYTDITALLSDKDGNIIRYGSICDDTSATSAEIEIPSGLSDGVYTLHITAEKRNEEKITDVAAVPIEIEVKVANEHNHPMCGVENCTKHGESVKWQSVTTTEELAAMEKDGYYFLIGNVEAPETACVGHLCTNGFSITGTLKAGYAQNEDEKAIAGLVVCDCRGKTTLPSVAVETGAIYDHYGPSITNLAAGENGVLNIWGGSNGDNGMRNAWVSLNETELGENIKINIYKGGSVNSTNEEYYLRPPKNCEIDVYSGGSLVDVSTPNENARITVHEGGEILKINLASADSVLTVEDGGEIWKITGCVEGSVINLYRCSAESILTSGTVNLYGAVSGATFSVDKPLNICGNLGEKPESVSKIDIKNTDGSLKWESGIFTDGWNTYMADAAYGSYFISATGYSVGKTDNGELRCEKKVHDNGSHPICGVNCSHNGAHKGVEWNEIKAWSNLSGGSAVATLTGGNYCLTANIKASYEGEIVIKGNVNICLNGYDINLNSGFIDVQSGTLTICDCVGNGRIRNGGGYTTEYTTNNSPRPNEKNSFGGAIFMHNGSNVNMYGGKLTSNMAHFGGAVYVPNGATFTLYNGTLSNNTGGDTTYSETYYGYKPQAFAKGGAVYLDGGKFVMEGGEISNNKTETLNYTNMNGINDGGGAVYISGGTLSGGSGQFIMNNGTISRNSATQGKEWNKTVSRDFACCGVRVFKGTFTMNGGKFDYQSDTVQVDSNGTFNFNGGEIHEETYCGYCRTSNTGDPSNDLYLGRTSAIWFNGGTVNMKGGKIYGTRTPINLFSGTFNMSNGTISDSNAVSIDGGTFNMSGGLVGSETAEKKIYGWGVTLNSGAFKMSGGKVTGYNGGVLVKGGTMTVSGGAKVTDNGTVEYDYDNPQNVYLKSGMKMNVGSMGSGAKIGVLMENQTGVFSSGGSGYANCFTSDDLKYTVSASGKNLQLGGGIASLGVKEIYVNGEALKADANNRLCFTVKVGETAQLSAKMEPSDAAFKWYYDGSSYYNLNTDTGVITTKKAMNSATDYSVITLVYDNGKQTKKIRITVLDPEFYTVTYDMQGHGTQIDLLQVTPREVIEAPTAPTAGGFTFGGWYKDSEFKEAWDFENDTVNANITLYAKWTAKSYAVTLDANGGTCSTKNVFLTCGQLCDNLPVPTRKGYNFDGWYDFEGDKLDSKTSLNKDLPSTQAGRTLTARWTPIPAKAPTITKGQNVNLTYGYANGGSISVTAAADSNHTIAGYQWYQCDDDEKTNSKAIKGATGSSYTIEKGKNAGVYRYYCEVTSKRKDNSEVATAQSDVIVVSVAKAKLNATVNMADYTYGEKVSVPTVSGNGENGTVSYYYSTKNSNSAGTEWKNITPTSLNKGTYYMYAEIAQTANYEKFTTPAVAFKVNSADPQVTWPTIDPIFVNDSLSDASLKGAEGDGKFSITGSKTWNTNGTKTTKVTFTPNNSNYNTVNTTVNVTVNKRKVKSVTTVIFDITDKDYGTAMSDLGLPSTVEILTDGNKSFTVPVVWSGYDEHKLTKQNLVGTLNLSAISKETEQPTALVFATASVTLKELIPGNVPFNDKNAIYTGEAISHTIESLPKGVASVTYNYKGKNTANVEYDSSVAPVDAGTYTVTVKFTMEPGYSQKANATAKLVIDKATPVLTVQDIDKVYNGEAVKNSEILGDAEGVSGKWNFKNGFPKNVTDSSSDNKSWRVVFTPNDTVNYKVTETEIKVTIREKEVIVSKGSYSVSKVYDTTTASGTAIGELSVSGILTGDDVNVFPTISDYTSADVGGQSSVEVRLVLVGDDKGNYALKYETVSVPCQITKATPNITDANAIVTYNKTVSNDDIKANTNGVAGSLVWENVDSYGDVGTRDFKASFIPSDLRNYETVENIEVFVTVNKAKAPVLTDISVSQVYGTIEEKSEQIGNIMPDDAGNLSYSTGTAGISGTAVVNQFVVDSLGLVKYTVTGGSAKDVITLPIIITTDRYEDATINVKITITQATPTGEPKYKKIHNSGKTLKEAELTTEESTFSVEGSVKWVDENNNALDENTVVERNTAYRWLFTPTSGNYTALSGTIKLYRTQASVESGGNGEAGGNTESGETGHYEVSFNTNGGSGVTNQTVAANNKVSEPETPTKEGYIFDGWYTDEGLTKKYDFSDKATKPMTLYAKWIQQADEPTVPSKTEWKNPFKDISESDWYFASVKYANENNLMGGISVTDFAPGMMLKRGMLVTVLYRLAGSPAVNKSMPFKDVSADSYCRDAIAWAQQNGIISGINETEFAPDNNITREQIAVILYRFAKAMGYGVSAGENTNILSYSDFKNVSEYATEAMRYAVGSGLITGKTQTTLNPKDSATRAEIAVILQRFVESTK